MVNEAGLWLGGNSLYVSKFLATMATPAGVPGARLLHEHNFPVFVTRSDEVAIVIEVEEFSPWTLRNLAREVRQLVVSILVNLESLVACLIALEQLLFDIRDANGRQ
jgi:hypothetical protein